MIKEIGRLMKRDEALSVEDAVSEFIFRISEATGWKLLKSQKIIKRTVGDLVFQINFHSSRWNQSYQNIEIQCECQLWCKKLDKSFNNRSGVGFIAFEPPKGAFWNITTLRSLEQAVRAVCEQIKHTVVPLSELFAVDFNRAVYELSKKEMFERYHVKIEFLDLYIDRESVVKAAQEYFCTLPKEQKRDIERYRNGAKDMAWMINPSNLKYIIDKQLI